MNSVNEYGIELHTIRWWRCLIAASHDGEQGIRYELRSMDLDTLDALAVEGLMCEFEAQNLVQSGAYPTRAPGSYIWRLVRQLADAERARRLMPRPVAAGNRIADIKAANRVEDVAGRLTHLTPNGPGKLKGCCPMHKEKTPSFVIYTDSQKWRCYGACARGGDVIDLARKVGVKL